MKRDRGRLYFLGPDKLKACMNTPLDDTRRILLNGFHSYSVIMFSILVVLKFETEREREKKNSHKRLIELLDRN